MVKIKRRKEKIIISLDSWDVEDLFCALKKDASVLTEAIYDAMWQYVVKHGTFWD